MSSAWSSARGIRWRGDLAPAAGLLVAAIGVLVLIGWTTGTTGLKAIVPGTVTMKPNTAVAFIGAGLALWLVARPGPARPGVVALLCAVPIGLGVLTVLEYVLAVDLGIDQFLFRDDPDPVGTSSAGRMAPTTAICFVLVGAGLLSMATGRRGSRLPLLILSLVALQGYVASLGYLLGVGDPVGIQGLTRMAAHTAGALMLLGVAGMLTRADHWFAPVARRDHVGRISRLFVVSAVLVPPLLTLPIVIGFRAGAFDIGYGVALGVAGLTAIGLAIIAPLTRRMADAEDDRLLRAEEARRSADEANRSRARFETLFELSPVPTIVSRMSDGAWLMANRAATKLTGYKTIDAVGRTSAQLGLLAPERFDREAYVKALELDGAVLGLDAVMRDRSGREHSILLSSALIDLDGERCVLSRLEDVTERIAREEELRRTTGLLEAVLASMAEAIIVVSRDGRVIRSNAAAQRLLAGPEGRLPDSLDGAVPGLFRIDGETPYGADEAPITRAMRGEVVDDEVIVVRPDPEAGARIVSVNARHIVDGPTAPALIVGRDVTEERQALNELRELTERLEHRVAERTADLEATNRELESFSYSVAHDLRAPLRAMDGFSNILLAEQAEILPPDAQRQLQHIREAASQMGRLIDQLLAFSRLGRQELVRGRVLTGELVRSIIEGLRPDAPGTRFEVNDLPDCLADPALLRVALTNLLGNAVKFSRASAPPSVRVTSKDDPARPGWVMYSIADNGVGFDPRHAEKLFGVFQRLHSAAEFEGNGIGLATVQRIVHRHGGLVSAESEVGRGATFRVTLEGVPDDSPRPYRDPAGGGQPG